MNLINILRKTLLIIQDLSSLLQLSTQILKNVNLRYLAIFQFFSILPSFRIFA
jgi:hypothetical protein